MTFLCNYFVTILSSNGLKNSYEETSLTQYSCYKVELTETNIEFSKDELNKFELTETSNIDLSKEELIKVELTKVELPEVRPVLQVGHPPEHPHRRVVEHGGVPAKVGMPSFMLSISRNNYRLVMRSFTFSKKFACAVPVVHPLHRLGTPGAMYR